MDKKFTKKHMPKPLLIILIVISQKRKLNLKKKFAKKENLRKNLKKTEGVGKNAVN